MLVGSIHSPKMYCIQPVYIYIVFLHSEVNEDDGPIAYASTYSLSNGVRHTYLELERGSKSTPHFAITTHQGSELSLSSQSQHSRPPLSVSGPLQGRHTSTQRTVAPNPGEAISMQIHRSSTRGGTAGRSKEMWGGSLREPPSGRPPLSMPALPPAPSTSPPPLHYPPTPEITDPPVPYSTPERPWYKSGDYESSKIPVTCTSPQVCG